MQQYQKQQISFGDLTDGILSLTFDETIDYRSFRSEFISIQGAFDTSVSIQIDPVERRLITTTYGLVIDFRLSEGDILDLKSDNTIATGLNDTYIIFRREMVNDVAGNAVVERQNGINSLQASNYTEDTIQPQVSQFAQLDMNTGHLRITFSEPILPENVVFSGITLQSTANGGNSVTLTGGTATSLNAQSTTLSIQLSRDDLRDVKILGDLGRSIFSSYLSISTSAFTDPAGNPVVSINSTSAIRANSYISDVTRPSIIMYEFDLDEGLMVLTFDDAIDLATFNPDQISLQNTADDTQMPAVSYTLTGFQVPPVTADNYVLNLTLSQTDLNNIKAMRGLARNQTSTYLIATGSTISDLFNNPLDSVVPSQAMQTALFTPDITFPNLVEYSLDLDIGALVISFDETVAIETFVPSEVVIQNVQNASEIGAVTLILSTAGSTNPNGTSMFFTYYLDNRDVNFIKEMMEVIGSELNNTFLSISSAGISDVEGNPVVAIEPDNALMASSRALDTSPPYLTSFSFNLNSGLLELSFSESVSGNSTMPQSFYLLSSPSMSATRYQLQGGVSSEDDSPTVQIQLTTSDLNNIKALVSLATSRETTYLAFFSDALNFSK